MRNKILLLSIASILLLTLVAGAIIEIIEAREDTIIDKYSSIDLSLLDKYNYNNFSIGQTFIIDGKCESDLLLDGQAFKKIIIDCPAKITDEEIKLLQKQAIENTIEIELKFIKEAEDRAFEEIRKEETKVLVLDKGSILLQ
jgi:hypothetical protein